MRASQCYQTTDENTVKITLISEDDYSKGLTTLSAFDRHCLVAYQFQGRLGDMGLICNAEGHVEKVYLGTGAKCSDTLAIAHGMNRLPKGSYQFDTTLSQSALTMWSLAQYRFDKYKINTAPLRRLYVSEQLLPVILAEADAIFLVRDLINTPANDMGPAALADVLATLAREHGAEFKQWIGDALLQDNFPAIYTVGRAASDAPRLLSLTWGNEHHPRVTLIGKGVCFDSGGLDIKPSSGMRLMKKDMGGAAQVIGLAQWLMTHRVPIRLQVLIPAVENAVDADAYRPGDIITMRNGATVEIHNTDAEGRLVLADAMVKAIEDKPELIIDFATLTGAARVAVGTEIAAMFSNHDETAQALLLSAQAVNDPVWRMPLFAGYEDLLNSSIADFANASESSYAGAITAALFLQRFIPSTIPWVHFDIMAWNVGNKPGRPEGGEAMGIRAVGYYLRQKYAL